MLSLGKVIHAAIWLCCSVFLVSMLRENRSKRTTKTPTSSMTKQATTLEQTVPLTAANVPVGVLNLEQQLHQCSTMLECVQLGICLTSHRKITRCNDAFSRLFGWSVAELTGKPCASLFPSYEASESFMRTATGRLRLGETVDAEVILMGRDGILFVAKLRVKAVNYNDINSGLVWVIEDVTERLHREHALQTMIAEHAAIFDNAMVGIAVTDERGVIRRCNQRMESLFGYPACELIGFSARRFHPHEEEWQADLKHWQTAESRQSVCHFERRFVRRDGSLFDCSVSGRSYEDADNAVLWVWIYEDQTEARQAQQALEQSKSELERRVVERTAAIKEANFALKEQLHFQMQLIEAIPTPVFFKDAELRYQGCNSKFANLMDWRLHEVQGKTTFDLPSGEVTKRADVTDAILLRDGGVSQYEIRLPDERGAMHDYVVAKASFSTTDGLLGGIVGTMLDVTDHRRLEQQLRQASVAFEHAAEGMVVTDRDGNIVAVNQAFCAVSHYEREQVIGRQVSEFIQDPHGAELSGLWKQLDSAGRWEGEMIGKRQDHSQFSMWLTFGVVRDSQEMVTHHVGVFSDLTALKQSQEKLDHQAHHDALTGLPNRLLMGDRLQHAMDRAKRYGSQLALMFIDLDRFKYINDTQGHPVGDAVLREVAKRLCSDLRDSDTVARLGGDEFVVLLEDIEQDNVVSRVGDKILRELALPIAVNGQEFFISASIGVAMYPQDGDDVATLIRNADSAMYRAKERGRNNMVGYDEGMTRAAAERFALERDLRRAIERDELVLLYQPQYSMMCSEVVGVEALLRWHHPEHGAVPPSVFIPIAEETGYIVKIGEWILNRACTDMNHWLSVGLEVPLVSINIAAAQVSRGNLVESVSDVLTRHQLPASRLELEITESFILNQAEEGIRVLNNLRSLGVNLAIDDFGSGYSSLSYLKRLPIAKLKIDQSFICDLPNNPDDGAIARAVVALGHSLGLQVVAEGVENQDQFQFLRRAGCDQIQGYYMASPMTVDEIVSHMNGQGHM